LDAILLAPTRKIGQRRLLRATAWIVFWLGLNLTLADPVNLFESSPNEWWRVAGILLLFLALAAIIPLPDELIARRLSGLEKALDKSTGEVQKSMKQLNDSVEVLQELKSQVERQRIAAVDLERETEELQAIKKLEKEEAEAVTGYWTRMTREGEQRALIRDVVFFALGIAVSVLVGIVVA
jgi:predicted ribosome quality control (RQC) complex YloA/Tae2 family protein